MPAQTRGLQQARLCEVTAGDDPTEVQDTSFNVQFNPASLKLSLSSHSSAHKTGQQERQHLGLSSSSLSFDLHFDTAEEGETGHPVSVRTKTAAVERFLIPKQTKTGNQPPKARFHWGDLVFDGLIDDLTIDFDFFAASGEPLRAKMTVTMKEQNPKYQLGKIGPGANTAQGATDPGNTSSGPGSNSGQAGLSIAAGASLSLTNQTATAIGGESAADFAARANLDPSAWRAIAGQLGDGSPLSLPAGLEVDFNASVSASASLGVTMGAEAGASVSLESAFGLDATSAATAAGPGGAAVAAAGASLSPATAAGFALAAAGGVSAALDAVSIVRTQAAVSATLNAFGNTSARAASLATPNAALPAGSTPAPAAPEQDRTPLRTTQGYVVTTQVSEPSAPPLPAADPRATSFGFGVPLRPRMGNAADSRTSDVRGRVRLRPGTRPEDVLTPGNPSAPPWTRLPVDGARTLADRVQATRTPPLVCTSTASGPTTTNAFGIPASSSGVVPATGNPSASRVPAPSATRSAGCGCGGKASVGRRA